MSIDRFGSKNRWVSASGAAINRRIAIEDFFPRFRVRDAEPKVSSRNRHEIADGGDGLFRIATAATKADDAVQFIMAVDPFKIARSGPVGMQAWLGAVDTIQVFDPLAHRRMFVDL